MALGDPYVSLSEFKSYLNLSDTFDDAELDFALATATSDIDEYCNRQFNDSGSATAREFLVTNRRRVIIDDFSTLTGLVVQTGSKSQGYTTTLTIDSDFIVSPEGGRIGEVPYSVWWRLIALDMLSFDPDIEPTLQVTARWGWAAVPDPVKQACLLWASRIFRRKDSPEGIIGGFDGAPIRVGWKMDPDIAMGLRRFRKHQPDRFGR